MDVFDDLLNGIFESKYCVYDADIAELALKKIRGEGNAEILPANYLTKTFNDDIYHEIKRIIEEKSKSKIMGNWLMLYLALSKTKKYRNEVITFLVEQIQLGVNYPVIIQALGNLHTPEVKVILDEFVENGDNQQKLAAKKH